jgi:hypothetical protein
MILELQAQRANIGKENIVLTVKYDLIHSIDATLAQLEKALMDCPPPSETFMVFTGTDGSVWCTFGDGIWIPTVVVPSDNVGVPVTPDVTIQPPKLPPGEVFKPQTPGGPPPGTPTGGTPTAGTPTTPGSTPPPTLSIPTPPITPTPPTPQTPPPTLTTDTPTTPETPPTQTYDTLFFKGDHAVLEGGQTGTPYDGLIVKLFAAKPEAPGNGPKTDVGYNKDPVQTKTGLDGTGTMKIDRDDRRTYGIPDYTFKPNFYRMDASLLRHDGGVVETTGRNTPTSQLTSPTGTKLTSNDFKIGDRTFTRLGFDVPFGQNVNFTNYYKPIFPGFGIDYCRFKAPGPPGGMEPSSLSALNHELPEATLIMTRGAATRRGIR